MMPGRYRPENDNSTIVAVQSCQQQGVPRYRLSPRHQNLVAQSTPRIRLCSGNSLRVMINWRVSHLEKQDSKVLPAPRMIIRCLLPADMGQHSPAICGADAVEAIHGPDAQDGGQALNTTSSMAESHMIFGVGQQALDHEQPGH